ncbi:ABC transporter ATP-binding protein [Streptococcus pneumoniae]|nr:ABC transporter ATP-binding protein [Streptococcus pneumoniae]
MAYFCPVIWSEKTCHHCFNLVLGAEIILLDEPTAGQDQKNYTEIMEFLEELHQKGHTIVMITHDMQLMLDYSDRVLVMVDGGIDCRYCSSQSVERS